MGTSVRSAVDLNQPGTYLHWSFLQISVANLVIIAVMVVLFGAALMLPFPRSRGHAPARAGGNGDAPPVADGPPESPELPDGLAGDGGVGETDGLLESITATATGEPGMWTAGVRRRALRLLPPERLLPGRQPAYVASWVYVFGVATLAALGVAIVSGFAIAVGGADWWHTNPVGHFFNSLHLWSIEIFMAFMVIHLWGKFWMAAWRGRRAVTWMTGVIAFMAAIGEAFTGYLAQQNFDSQWISTNAKDAFNSVGVGAFWNVMNFGQMLLWHVVLIPIVLVAVVGAHVLLVRARGVSHPLPARRVRWRDRGARRAVATADAAGWRGPTRRYDILKEGTIATSVALVLTVVLAAVLSSPDVPSVSVRTWSTIAPADFLATAATELNGTSETATYGPPYNAGTGSVQRLVFSPQQGAGVTQHVDAARVFVLAPLAMATPSDPGLATALGAYTSAPPKQQAAWVAAYLRAVAHVTFAGGTPVVPSAADGPVPAMLAAELAMARAGTLDTDLLAQRSFYGTDFTKPLLFIEDGSYFSAKASAMHLAGSQWGVMNETGSYPGQPWLWLYSLWYQVPGFSSAANVDMIAVYLTGLATLLLLLVPFIPGLRDIPEAVPIHRLIWRSWYRAQPPSRPRSAPGHADAGADDAATHPHRFRPLARAGARQRRHG